MIVTATYLNYSALLYCSEIIISRRMLIMVYYKTIILKHPSDRTFHIITDN